MVTYRPITLVKVYYVVTLQPHLAFEAVCTMMQEVLISVLIKCNPTEQQVVPTHSISLPEQVVTKI